MKILLTGATGYIGKRLLPALLERAANNPCALGAGLNCHPAKQDKC